MVLHYLTYASAVFQWSLFTRSPSFAVALFFVFHVPFWWHFWSTGLVSEQEFFVYYPAVAVLAALLGYLLAIRLNLPRLVSWLRARDLDEKQRQWLQVARYFTFLLLLHAPSLALELLTEPSKRWLASLLSLLGAALVHVLFWACARRDCTLSADVTGRRTFFLWFFIFDVLLLRLPYTLLYATQGTSFWPFSFWPLYVMLASLGFALVVGLLTLEFGFLRAHHGSHGNEHAYQQLAPVPVAVHINRPVHCRVPHCTARSPCSSCLRGGHGHGHGYGPVSR